jgi:uncharacterized protein YcbK (DUF882 family)
VHVGKARLRACGLIAARAGYSFGAALLVLLFVSRALQNAIAEGDTRTISMHHVHTNEDITITYKRDGQYDEAALEKLNWFLRDWRKSQETQMDPHLIDVVWEVQRETGSTQPIWVVCGYRSPETNAMLRRHSTGVARFSQHMLGKAMDFYIPGVPLSELRAYGLRLQRGGVGFYPTSGSPFVHMDTGGIRMWPRMTHDELVKVFPDGRTVHIPTDGRPLPGYALALADIRTRGSDPSDNSLEAARSAGIDVGPVADGHSINPFAKLLGLRKHEEDEDDDAAESAAPAASPATPSAKPAALAKLEHAAAKTVAVARAEVAAAPKLLRAAATMTRAEAAPTAATPPRPDGAATSVAAASATQVITARGYWEGQADVTAARPATNAGLDAQPQRTQLADASATGSIGPWPNAVQDRVPPELALAYATQPDRGAQLQATPVLATSRATGASDNVTATNPTTGDKGLIAQARVQTSANVKVGAQFNDPWLNAIVVSPSVQRFLTTLTLGARDFTALAALMVKPASSVVMTFSTDPNLGLTPNHFSGSAVVFVSTVTYPTHTAFLQ